MRSPSKLLRCAAAGLIVGGFLAAALPPAEAAVPSFTIYGRGWGHGVGMSQWGAKGLADQGFKMGQILSRFYAGTAVGTSTAVQNVRVGLLQEQTAMTLSGNGRFD